MPEPKIQDPLHGVTLKMIITRLVEKYGWEELGETLNINAFKNNPTYKSSLRFLRTTAWAREKVEKFYLKNMLD